MLDAASGTRARLTKGVDKLRRFGHVDQIAVQQHRRADTDGEAGDGGDDRLVRPPERFDEIVGLESVAFARGSARRNPQDRFRR